MSGSAHPVPSLDSLVYDTTKLVHWPGTEGSIYDDWSAEADGEKPSVGRLGSGSDYTAFLDHFGVPALDIGSSTVSGDYHCACDNHYMESRFIDPGWRYHAAMAREVGLATMRFADADVAQLRYAPYADEVVEYLQDFQQAQEDRLGKQVIDVDRDIAAARAWKRAGQRLQSRIETMLENGASEGQIQAANRKLRKAERALLAGPGLPGRKWYRHQIYAPGVNEGYGTQTLPGLHDAVFLHHDTQQAKRYEKLLHRSLKKATRTLRDS